jgi:hypothetical protein
MPMQPVYSAVPGQANNHANYGQQGVMGQPGYEHHPNQTAYDPYQGTIPQQPQYQQPVGAPSHPVYTQPPQTQPVYAQSHTPVNMQPNYPPPAN